MLNRASFLLADKKGLSIVKKGRYIVTEQADENLQIEFFEN